ncbi:MAG: hypothetical protein NC418_04345 [Muribaculaceae bacterium]|nr:hypothetical protein [Muribaculaceae bacterium]
MKKFVIATLAVLVLFFTATGADGSFVNRIPEALYLVGTVSLPDVDSVYTYMGEEFERDGDMMICRNVTLHAGHDGYAEFIAAEKRGAENWNSNVFYTKSHRWSFENTVVQTNEVGRTTNGSLMTVLPGTYDFFLSFAGDNPVLTIAKSGATDEEIMQDIAATPFYVVGFVAGENPGSTVFFDRKFEYGGGLFLRCEKVDLSYAWGDGLANFAIVQNHEEATWSTGPCMTAPERNWSVPRAQTMILKSDATTTERVMTVAPGTYDFILDYTSFTPVLNIERTSLSTGAAQPEAGTSEPEYYSPSGWRLSPEARGLVICRRGTSVRLELK